MQRVTSTAQAPGVDASYQAHEQEALLLVELLRSSRLSLLYAEPGTDKTALLRFGLIPLLCRRAGDRVVPAVVRASGVVVPFPDRRSRSSARASKRRREIVVYFDGWSESPLAALREALYEAVAADQTDRLQSNARLSGILEDLSRRFDAHLIVLLDRFEGLRQASSDDAAIDQFANELAEAINQPQLPANFLIALQRRRARGWRIFEAASLDSTTRRSGWRRHGSSVRRWRQYRASAERSRSGRNPAHPDRDIDRARLSSRWRLRPSSPNRPAGYPARRRSSIRRFLGSRSRPKTSTR